jgi:hypothetical protein
MNFFKKGYPYLILLLVVILGYWQISFLTYALKWDTIDVVFPFRFHFSECIHSGYFPFWNPYQQTGTPFFADLQAPTYYPELLFVSLFSGYGIYTMHFLFVFYVFIAAVGMFKLSFSFNKSQKASFMAAIAYAFSGFVVGHGQHFFLLIGTAWLPFVIKNYIALHKNRNWINVLKTAVFVFLMVTGAYQALSIVLFYLMLLLFLYFILKDIKQKDYTAVREIITVNFYLLGISIVLLLPLILSTLEVLPFVDRFQKGVSLGTSLSKGQSFESLRSFLLPFSTIKNEAYSEVINFSVRNHYFGLIPLVFFIAGLLKKRSVLEYLILIFGLLIFATAFDSLPVRKFMFAHVPLMNLFIVASYTRIFGLFAFILLSANYLTHCQLNWKKERIKLLTVSLFASITLVWFLWTEGKITTEDLKIFAISGWLNEIIHNREFHQHLPLQEIIQLIILLSFTAIILLKKRIKYAFHFILILTLIEVFAANQLNMSSSVIDCMNKPYKMKRDLTLYPEKFPIPVNDKIGFNEKPNMVFSPFGRNSNIYSKQVSFSGFSSFELKTYSKLDDKYPNLKNTVLNNHLFYFSDSIFSILQFSDSTIHSQRNSKDLYLNDEDFKVLSENKVATYKDDEIEILEFSPNKVVIETNTKNDQYLTMLQTNFKGWKASIDDKNTPIYSSNFNYRTLFLPKGNHTVCYEYKNNKILFSYILSNAVFLFILLVLLGYMLRRKGLSKKYILTAPALILALILSFLTKQLVSNNTNLSVSEQYNTRWPDKDALYMHTLAPTMQQSFSDSTGSNKKGIQINAENDYFTLINLDNTDTKFKEGTLVLTAKVFPKTYLDALIVSDISRKNYENKWNSSNLNTQIEKLNQWNEIIYCRNYYDMEESDTLHLYLWNLNKENFKLDDVKIRFFAFKH